MPSWKSGLARTTLCILVGLLITSSVASAGVTVISATWETEGLPFSERAGIVNNKFVIGPADTSSDIKPAAGQIFARVKVRLTDSNSDDRSDLVLGAALADAGGKKYEAVAILYEGVWRPVKFLDKSFRIIRAPETSEILFAIPRDAGLLLDLLIGEKRIPKIVENLGKMPAAPSPKPPQNVYCVFDGFGLRDSPSPSSEGTCKLNVGQQVTKTREREELVYVTTDGGEGWIPCAALVPSRAVAERIASNNPKPNALFVATAFTSLSNFQLQIWHGKLRLPGGKLEGKPRLEPGNCIVVLQPAGSGYTGPYQPFGFLVAPENIGKLLILDNAGGLAVLDTKDSPPDLKHGAATHTAGIGKVTVTADQAPIVLGKVTVQTAKKGEVLEVTQINGAWYGVLPTRGWIHKSNVRYEPAPAARAIPAAGDKGTTTPAPGGAQTAPPSAGEAGRQSVASGQTSAPVQRQPSGPYGLSPTAPGSTKLSGDWDRELGHAEDYQRSNMVVGAVLDLKPFGWGEGGKDSKVWRDILWNSGAFKPLDRKHIDVAALILSLGDHAGRLMSIEPGWQSTIPISSILASCGQPDDLVKHPKGKWAAAVYGPFALKVDLRNGYVTGIVVPCDSVGQFRSVLQGPGPVAPKPVAAAPKSSKEVARLTEQLDPRRTSDPKARANAAEDLGWTGDVRAVPALVRGLDDPDEWVVIKCCEALMRLPDKAAVDPLIALVNRQKSCWGTLPAMAVGALVKIGDKRAVPAIIAAVRRTEKSSNANSPDFRKQYVDGLQTLTGQSFGEDAGKWEAWWRDSGNKVLPVGSDPAPKAQDKGKPSAKDLLPPFSVALEGKNPVRVRNPNDFSVLAGVRSGSKGIDLDVPANGVHTVYVPDGKYDIYFVYSSKPDALFQGDSFTLNGDGVEIQIVKVVGGNYNIRQVK